ncbi:MAG: thiamine phosphate synthase [Planctomycetota bacterium]
MPLRPATPRRRGRKPLSSVLRLIDANANRAREALRVMEDAARFLRDDAELARAIKTLRHDLAAALRSVAGLEAHRDTPGDVGTAISTPAEATRRGAAGVARAAGKRLGEALRSIEEYAKTLGELAAGPAVARDVERLRYRGYELERRLNLTLGTGAARPWRLCVLLTESLCRWPWRDVLDAALGAGADCVQLREKTLDDGEWVDRAMYVAQRCRDAGAPCVVNDRPDLALLAGADGVHVGQTDLPPEAVRRLVGTRLLVGVSTANLAEARAAVQGGADYVGLGPMFPTTTKHKPDLAGPGYVEAVAADPMLKEVPHLAIGGVTPENVGQLVAAGARGVAVSSCVCAADDPGVVVKALLASIPEPA